jgi:hypothetical protein
LSQLTEQKIAEIRRVFSEKQNAAETARICQVGAETVRKYAGDLRKESETEVDEVLVVDTYRREGTLAATFAQLPYGERTIRRVLAEHNIDTSRPGHDEGAICAFYLENDRAVNATMEQFGIGHATLKKILRKNNMHLPTAGGRVEYREPKDLPLPEDGRVKRYILTSAQNNTPVHEAFWNNLLLAAEDLKAEIMVARYTYNKSSYANAKSVKVGHAPTQDDLASCWYDDHLAPHFCDGPGRPERYRLAPGLVWCSEMNILPTDSSPLTSLEGYTRRESGIFPHAKLAMRSVASLKKEPTKFNWTTGTVTQRNYIQKRAGLKAEFWHSYSALLVEVDSVGNWWVRQLEADQSGVFYDLTTRYDGKITRGVRPIAINWGDVHAAEIEEEVIGDCCAILEDLEPENQFMHDLLSFRSRSHHEMKVPSRMYEKMLRGEESVDGENSLTAQVANEFDDAGRHTQMYVVNSNHDRHGEKWLDDANWKDDLLNAKHFFTAWLARIEAMESEEQWQYSEWALKRSGLNEGIEFLKPDEPFELVGIEFSLHGDEGPNGARGSTRNLTKLGRKINKGHDHTATIDNDVWSAGACHLDFAFMSGPSGHSISHILTYPNGCRTMLTVWNGRYRA